MNRSAQANFAGEDGWREPSRTHSHAKIGARMITNRAWIETNHDA